MKYLFKAILFQSLDLESIVTSDPDTNGSYCPGRVTFTCNGTDVANGLQWLINGSEHYNYILSSSDNDFPKTVSNTNNITIAVISASPVENSNGINILSTLTVKSLHPILDDRVACQTLLGPSMEFVVYSEGT